MPSIRTLRADAGFGLIELLVGTAIALIVLSIVVTMFAAARRMMGDQVLRVETLQAVRSTLDMFGRDLRLAGACLPNTGDFITLEGTDAAALDDLVVRSGAVQGSMACTRTSVRDPMPQTAHEIKVESTEGFEEGMRAYIRHTNGSGEFFEITQVQPAASMLQKDGPSSQDYPVGSGVYPIDERRYAIDTSDPNLPVLTIARDGGDPMPFAGGVESLDVEYVLARNCPNCDVVALPADDEWNLVNEVRVRVTGRSRRPTSSGEYYRYTDQITGKPRNLLPGG